MTSIIPNSKAKGTDICSTNEYKYIIRSDLGYYMKTSDLHGGSDISIFPLHPSCQSGDHYIGDHKGYFYIIKGDSYRTVTDLTTDNNSYTHNLYPDYCGGDHYFEIDGKFYIIFQEKGTYRTTTNLCLDSNAEEKNLHPDCRNGLYFWGASNFCFFLKPASKWGVEFCWCIHFTKDHRTLAIQIYRSLGLHTNNSSVHPDIVNFLPGGLSVSKGPTFGRWENIKTISNDSNTPVTWQKRINKKVGYNKEKMTEITRNWKIDMSASVESGALCKLIVNSQFSFSGEYGGSDVNTDKVTQDNVTEEEEQLTFELKPNESVYLWQYKLNLGEEPVLFCRDLKITSDPNPPTEVPLPPAQS